MLYQIKTNNVKLSDEQQATNNIRTCKFNPDNNPLIEQADPFGDNCVLLLSRYREELKAFFRAMIVQAVKPTRLIFTIPENETLISQINDYENLLEEQIDPHVFPSCDSSEWHNHRQQLSWWAVLLNFHINQWMGSLVAGDLGLLTSTLTDGRIMI